MDPCSVQRQILSGCRQIALPKKCMMISNTSKSLKIPDARRGRLPVDSPPRLAILAGLVSQCEAGVAVASIQLHNAQLATEVSPK